MSKLKHYRVYVTQYCVPMDIMAVSTTQAKRIAREDRTWEVMDADIRAERQEEIDRKDYQYRGGYHE